MSLLTPERVPVKVYRWDDAGAPALDKTAGCVMRIFKACLDTGYGSKSGAGWSTAFDDVGTTVLRPEFGMHIDFYLRLSADTGSQIVAQVYLNMSDANTGDLKLQLATPFKYKKGRDTSGKWILIATPRSFWFINESAWSGSASKNGAYFFSGDLSQSSVSRPVYLHHTGGAFDDGNYSTLTGIRDSSPDKGPNYYLKGRVLLDSTQDYVEVDVVSLFDSSTNATTETHAAPIVVIANKLLSRLPGIFTASSGAVDNNFDIKSIMSDAEAINMVVMGTGVRGASNFYLSTDYWSY